jgi:hypothetical protein
VPHPVTAPSIETLSQKLNLGACSPDELDSGRNCDGHFKWPGPDRANWINGPVHFNLGPDTRVGIGPAPSGLGRISTKVAERAARGGIGGCG